MERGSKQHDGSDVRVALLKQLGIADADLKLLLAADSTKINGGGVGGGGLSAFRSFCRKVSNSPLSNLNLTFSVVFIATVKQSEKCSTVEPAESESE